jgi:hypothetical protein
MEKAALKQRAVHEVREFLVLFLFLAPWFLAFSTYRMLLLKRFGEGEFEYGTGLINALILAKVIAMGQIFRIGTRLESKPLIYSTIWKSFLFALLAGVFYVVEHMVRGLFRGGGFAGGVAALHEIGVVDVLGRSLVMFFAFVPFFGLRETGRVLGGRKLQELFFGTKAEAVPPTPQSIPISGNDRQNPAA